MGKVQRLTAYHGVGHESEMGGILYIGDEDIVSTSEESSELRLKTRGLQWVDLKVSPKRVNFVGIQHDHGVACPGYTQPMVRTGYEQIIAQRAGDMFSVAARKPGKVISVKDTGIIIQYEDGETKGFEIGRRFGTDSGLTFAHEIKTNYRVGDTFKAGDIITYNSGFFERDHLNKNNMVWKQGVLVNTVLYESGQTHEDASSISRKLAEKLSTTITKTKIVKVSFDQVVRNLVEVGTTVKHDSILCIVEDAVTSNSNMFDEDSLNTLRLLSSQAPTAKTKGVVEKIEVFYHGDKEDMSPSLRAIANMSDMSLAKLRKSINKPVVNGDVADELNIDGESLAFETVAIKFYITHNVVTGIGDKGVFANQLKTVFSEVMDYDMVSEKGIVIDAVFGAKSVNDRIVISPFIIGTTNVLLELIGKKAAEIYFK